jgi:hypothetical protein
MKRELNRNRNQKRVWLFLVPIVLLSYFSVIAFSYKDSWFFSWNGIRPGVEQWVKAIEKDDLKSIREQHLHVANNLYEEESSRLLNYPNAEIRLIATLAELYADSSQVFNLSKRVFSDKEMFLRKSYTCCFGPCPKNPAEYLYSEIFNEESGLGNFLSIAQKKELENLYLTSKSRNSELALKFK